MNSISKSERIVVKIGTGVLTSEDGKLDLTRMRDLTEEIAELHAAGRQIVIVTSGAIAAGRSRLGLREKELEKMDVPLQQTAAAVGQSVLMRTYDDFLSRHGIISGQVLLTQDDFCDEARLNNLRNTIETLLSKNAIPIINENDTVAINELMIPEKTGKTKVFGDNDRLSALIAAETNADCLVMLSDVDGLFQNAEESRNGGKIVKTVERIDEKIEKMAGEGGRGRGGMSSKIQAAKLATSAGVTVVLANGKKEGTLRAILSGQETGTTFFASPTPTNVSAAVCAPARQGKISEKVLEAVEMAKEASVGLGLASTERKNAALEEMAAEILKAEKEILAANEKDVAEARKKGVKEPLVDRLALDSTRVGEMAEMTRLVAGLEDPVGKMLAQFKGAQGIEIAKKSVPLGVIAIVYESRPNVTADAAALCVKSGNAVVLRGGSDALNSNKAIIAALEKGLKNAGFSGNEVVLLRSGERSEVTDLLKCDDSIDAVIPRGGEGLIKFVRHNSSIPVIETGTGNCHLYVHEDADLKMATEIAINAKCQRPGTCNAIETLLVHEKIADNFLPLVGEELRKRGVEVRGDEATRRLLPWAKPVKEEDWKTEFLDLILAVKVVKSLDEAIGHINQYGTKHSEAIVTGNEASAKKFLKQVDAAAVYWNASTRFTDGGQFGFGAEMGISTQKLHARGPMGLPELCSYKYEVVGNGQVRK